MNFGVVVIGRNEGERLRRCLRSLSAPEVVYVDSGSTDGSVQWARDYGVNTIELEANLPFTAARARNAGFRRLRELKPEVAYVQFVDGDCELIEGWLQHASAFLDTHADVAAVTGQLLERDPEQSIYNWLCDEEWRGPTGVDAPHPNTSFGIHGRTKTLTSRYLTNFWQTANLRRPGLAQTVLCIRYVKTKGARHILAPSPDMSVTVESQAETSGPCADLSRPRKSSQASGVILADTPFLPERIDPESKLTR